MQKILSLGTKQFKTGIAPSLHSENGGMFYTARGITPFQQTFGQSALAGTLAAGPTPTDISSSVVVDEPWAATYRVTGAGSGKVYIIGSSGHFYQMTSLSTPTDLRSGTPITNPAKGVFTFKPNGGTEYLFYFQTTQIGRWDLSGSYPTGWTDNHFTGLQSTTLHFPHVMNDEVYYTNKDRIGKVYDSSGTATNNTNVLDFPSDFIATCLEDDGTYLIAGITKNLGDNDLKAETKIIFWDKGTSSWNKEWTIEDTTINAIKKVGNIFLAVCGRNLWAFNFNIPPTRVLPLADSSFSVPYGYANAISTLGDAVVWGTGNIPNGNQILCTFGKISPDTVNAYLQPFGGFTGDISLVVQNPFSATGAQFLVGTTTPALFHTNGNPLTSVSAQTVMFDLKNEYDIKRVDLIFAEALASGDSIDIDVATDDSGSATDWNTASFATHGAVRRVELYGPTPIATDQLSLVINFNGGAANIKRIDIYGEQRAY